MRITTYQSPLQPTFQFHIEAENATERALISKFLKDGSDPARPMRLSIVSSGDGDFRFTYYEKKWLIHRLEMLGWKILKSGETPARIKRELQWRWERLITCWRRED